MKYSHRLSDAVHILVYLEILGSNSSSAIAENVNSNPSLIRRLIAHMVKGGILERSGQHGEISIKLTRPAAQVSLLDIYQAVESHQEFLDVDQEINHLHPPEPVHAGRARCRVPACPDGGRTRDGSNQPPVGCRPGAGAD